MEEKWLGQIFFLLSFFASFWCISCCGKMEEALLGQLGTTQGITWNCEKHHEEHSAKTYDIKIREHICKGHMRIVKTT